MHYTAERQKGLAEILESSLNEIYIFDAETLRFLEVNRAARGNLGYSLDELRALTPLDLKPLFTERDFAEIIGPLKAGQRDKVEFITVHRRKDGSEYPVEMHLQRSVLESRPVLVAMILDITERRRAEEALLEEKEKAQVTLHSIGDAVITTDDRSRVEYLNPIAEALTGWTAAEARGQPLANVFRIVEEQSRREAADPVARCLSEGMIVGLANHSVLISRDGKEYNIDDSAAPIRGRDGRILGAVLVFHDVTETRRLAQQMAHDATHDALTGLVNRRELELRLERALESAKSYGTQHALCYLDLDQFKIVNDAAGHAAGDELLRQIKSLLAGAFRERDTLARLGGDEFGLLLDNCPLPRAVEIARSVVKSIGDYCFVWNNRGFQIGVSIGLVPVTAASESTGQLLSQADVACYTAKEQGRGRVHVYERLDSEPAQRHRELLRAATLRDALEQSRFRLYWQPIMTLGGERPEPVCYEMLLRLLDDDGQIVPPAAFIPAAERFGLMTAIDRWVIDRALQIYVRHFAGTPVHIAINLSGNSLNEESLLDFVRTRFQTLSIPPGKICFEITETAAIHNLAQAAELMQELKGLGSQLTLDDFGSGLSSFRYLKALPIDYLKIDGSFVHTIDIKDSDRAIVAAINQLGHTLGMRTIAEHACSPAIVEQLRLLGVDYAQGYALGMPEPVDLTPSS